MTAAPLIAWGTPDDLALWSVSGGTTTGGQADPFGGTAAFLLDDTSTTAAASMGLNTTTGPHGSSFAVFLKAGTAATTTLGWRDFTASVWRQLVDVTWTGGVPAVATVDGSGTLPAPIAVGGGWYLIRFAPADVAPGNVQRTAVYFTGSTTASLTGTTYCYLRNAVTLAPLDDMLAYAEPREGSRTVRSPLGNRDTWDTGTDYYLDALARYIPATDSTDPNVSGWHGIEGSEGGAARRGVNCGVQAMLTAGRKGWPLLYCPDRAAVSDYLTAELVDPLDGGVDLEPNGQRRLAFTLRSTTAEFPAYTT